MRTLLVVCIAACQPLYNGPTEHLHTPPPHPHKDTVGIEPIAYVDDCQVDFQREPHHVHRQATTAATLVGTGDASLATATTTTDATAKANLVVAAIQKYGDALRADPYDASATLGLALAYDHVLHRGCALAMLRRLESLTSNPQLAEQATHKIDDVVDNPQWFRGYRKDALAAVNH